MHGTVRPRIIARPVMGHQRLFEAACPGIADSPHRAKLHILNFWVQNYWGRWSHSRRCFADLRTNGKIRCNPDSTWETTAAIGLSEVLCRKLDYKVPKKFSKTPLLGFFLLWLLAMLDLGPTWEDSPPEPQHKNIKTYRRGLAPFHDRDVQRPDEAEERRLIKLAKGGDVFARNTIIAGHIWLAKAVARKFHTDDVKAYDLSQEATLALFKALDDFKPKSGARFSTFAWNSVHRDVQDRLREMRRQGRHISTELIAERNGAALGLYGTGSARSGAEYKIFRELFGKT
jgi:hypothetical protein